MTAEHFDQIIDRRGTASIKWDLLGKLFGRDDLLALWVADSDFPVPQAVQAALRRRAEHPFFGYTYPPDSWYQAIQSWLSRRHGWKVEREWILFSPGVVPALHLCVQALTEPGSAVVYQPPVYGPFRQAILSAERQPLPNPLRQGASGFKMDCDHLSEILKAGPQLLLFCSPHNPVGRVWTEAELMDLGQVCLQREIVIVSDEIHADLVFPEARHRPLAMLLPELAERTITCMSASKTFGLAGLVNAFLIVPNRALRKRLLSAQERMGMKLANIFGLVATEAALQHGGSWLEAALRYLNANRNWLADFISQYLPEIGFEPPEGTYLAWLDFRAWPLPADELRQFLVEKASLALEDGRNFGTEGAGWQRLNFACPRAILQRALTQLLSAVRNSITRE
jgi:cystathionine beta-lyase